VEALAQWIHGHTGQGFAVARPSQHEKTVPSAADGRRFALESEPTCVLVPIRAQFALLKKQRRIHPANALIGIGSAAESCLRVLASNCDAHAISWQGSGGKRYHAYTLRGAIEKFSRPVRDDLFISDPSTFSAAWSGLVADLTASAGGGALGSMSADDVDRTFYTAVTGFAATMEAGGSGDRGGPGTFFEMAVGPAVSLLTGINEESAIKVPVPNRPGEFETVTTDLSFAAADGSPVLVLPTKISTRERISQAYVHQAILERADSARTFRSALCIGAETNMFAEQGIPKTVYTAFARDTLVPNTIVLYQRYIAALEALYYLDPPHDYLANTPAGFPAVKRFSSLLLRDLPTLLAP
jgi:hypothetical protein